MKKLLFSLCIATAGFSEWILLEQQTPGMPVADLTFTDLLTDTYEDYIFVVDVMGSAEGPTETDIYMQVSTDNGETWVTTYSGGLASFSIDDPTLKTVPCSELGIPLTDYANEGYHYSGQIELTNANGNHYGTAAFSASGCLSGSRFGCIAAALNGASPVRAVRFVNGDSSLIQNASVTLYALQQTFSP